MYKTVVNMLVNLGITHQKPQISKRWYCSAVHWHLGNVMLRNMQHAAFLIFAVFDV